MNNRRRFNRWDLEDDKSAAVTTLDFTEDAKLLDISAGGMRVGFSRPVKMGSIIQGEFNILPNMRPFYGRGEVTRVEQKEKIWEVAVRFDKVSTLPMGSLKVNKKNNWMGRLKKLFG